MARTTRYPALLGELEKYICSLPPGTRLPSEQELAERFGISKPTFRRAAGELAKKQIIRRINGSGSVTLGRPQVIPREIFFLCHDLHFFAATLDSFCRQMELLNYFCAAVPLSGDRISQERILSTCLARSPAGIAIYADPDHQDLAGFAELEQSSIPSVYLCRRPEGASGNLVAMRNDREMAEIVRSFYLAGRRKFALYGNGSVNPMAAKERRQGFLDGLRRCRLKAREELVLTATENAEGFWSMFSGTGRPDAVCCLDDLYAGNFMREAAARSIDLNGISISGFDDLLLNTFLPYPISTVSMPLEEMGRSAANLLTRAIENPNVAAVTRNVKAKHLKKISSQGAFPCRKP